MIDPYKVLEINQTATDDEIKIAYRKMAKKYHPDLNGGSKAAEQKMKEVNEAYNILIKHKNQQSSNNTYHSGSYYHSDSGNAYSNSYQSSYEQNSQQQWNENDWNNPFGFDFGSFFNNQSRTYQTSSYYENDPVLQTASRAVLSKQYQQARYILDDIQYRKASWYYWSAQANLGLGNRMSALSDADTAVKMAPDEPAFRELLAHINASSNGYQQRQYSSGFNSNLCGNPCNSLCLAYAVCNCCCLGGRGFFCC